ncbi:MAG: diaminopimelate decarboxylase [Actinomycetota bacterium]|jgi:diaminopimelate decarboxylase
MASDLNPIIWPASATRNDQGEIAVGGVTVSNLATQYGTPLYVFDEADVRQRARDYVAAFTVSDIETSVHYAGKAFITTKIAQWVNQEGLGIDVASVGELEVALRAGIDPNHIVMHGNNKSVKDLERAVEVGVGRIVIDSLIEIERLNAVAANAGIVQQVFLRLTVGVEAHTHEAISTAHEDQKFGLSVASGMAMAAVDNVLECDALSLAGLHSHIGSQIFDATGFELATHRVVDFAVQIKDRHGISVSELDVGGGMGIAYIDSDDPLDVATMAKSILDIVRTECARVNISVPKISVEPGRAIIGNPGITLYEVGTVKPVELDSGITRHYISVDGGMSDNIRTALYDAEYTAVIANRDSNAKKVLSRVVGKHCESGDIVVRDIELPADIRPGDLIAVAATGAYCRSMASNYNHMPRPAAVSVCAGQSQVLLRRETIEDLIAFDAGIN